MPLKEEIEELSNNGVQHKGQKIGFTVSAFLGDSLAIYQLLGHRCCFKNESYTCSTCLATGTPRTGFDCIQNVMSNFRPIVSSKTTNGQLLATLNY